MHENNLTLLSPLAVRGVTLRNRVVMPPMVTLYGVSGPRSVAYYEERARAGVGLVIVEAVAVCKFREDLGGDALRPLAEAIRRHGAAAVVQLFVQDRADPKGETGPLNPARTVAEAPRDELLELQDQLVHAARSCRSAGFDGVEIHGAHCFFLNSFLSPEHNRRTDDYGGDLEGRMRMGLECARRVREALDDDALLLYRHTPQWAGYGLGESRQFARRLVSTGVDILDVSPSTAEGGGHAELAREMKNAVTAPVIAVGGMSDPAAAEAALREGRCDLCAIGRGLLADAEWVAKVREGRTSEVTRCTECGVACFGNLAKGQPIGCVNNPRTGHELEAG